MKTQKIQNKNNNKKKYFLFKKGIQTSLNTEEECTTT